MESKKEIYDLIPPGYYPKTFLFKKDSLFGDVVSCLQENGLHFPLIGKPDIGMQGIAVKKLENKDDLWKYISLSKVDFLIQDFVSLENEAGIFYYRYPGESNGHVSGIVEKQFLTVIGNGKESIEELLQKEKRFVLQLPALKRTNNKELNIVLKEGESYLLVPYGNHARGAKFIDASHIIDKELTSAIDKICKQVDGFYFGRLDVRFNTWEDLKQGKNFSIIELNGAGSEPTHMYDPKHSIFFAWKEIARHWKILFQISMSNHRGKKIPFMKRSAGVSMFREYNEYLKLVSNDNHIKYRDDEMIIKNKSLQAESL